MHPNAEVVPTPAVTPTTQATIRPTIICVDDDPLVLDSLGEQLRRELAQDYDIELARDAAEVLALFADLTDEGVDIPVLISDQRMPGVSGVGLLAKINQHYPQTLSILLTGESSLEEVAQAVNTGNLYRYIPKPWEQADLLLTVKEALRCYAQEQEIVAQQAALHYQANYDYLTGVCNRKQLDAQLTNLLALAESRQEHLAVLFIDLDHFKVINDTLGHGYGDALLQLVVHRLQKCSRHGDVIARWGGDEFTVVLPNIQGRDDAVVIAERLLAALQPSFDIETHSLRISCSIGIALYPEDGQDTITLLKNADTALGSHISSRM